MSNAGRPPKPTKLKVLQGTDREDREKNYPKYEPVFPHDPPKDLPDKEVLWIKKF
jgi:hypothetical protein